MPGTAGMRFPFLFPKRKTEEEKRQIMKKTDHRESAQRRRPGDPYEEAPDPLCVVRLEGPDGDLGDAIARDMRSMTSRTGRRQEKHRKGQGAGLHSPREGNTSFCRVPC